ncbi:MAG: DUF177 domain-containing protein [Bacteroidales bacterium]|nr:DUF177 domain-containing protein [Bacteroidales bacterium]
MKDDFIVPLNGLAQGRTEFRRSVGKEFFERFENSEILAASLDVDVVVEKSGRYIGVDSQIDGTVTVTCDRCLADLRLPVSTGFSLSVKFGDYDSDGDEEGDREVVVLPMSDTDLDLSQTVYDYICLSLPVQRVHEDGECDPETVRFLSSEDEQGQIQKDSSSPFAGLKDLLDKK